MKKHAFVMIATLAFLSTGIVQARADVYHGGGPPGGGGGVGPNGTDPMFDWTFAETGVALIASGTLTAITNGDGTFTATGGSGTVSNGLAGETTLSLYLNPSPPGEVVSPNGMFLYDNQLLPGQNPLITNGGLLFTSNVASQEVNIFSNGAYPSNLYSYYTGSASAGYNATGGVFTLNFAAAAAAPEPSTMALAGLGALGMIGYGLRRRISMGT